jgi:hypothetical protein
MVPGSLEMHLLALDELIDIRGRSHEVHLTALRQYAERGKKLVRNRRLDDIDSRNDNWAVRYENGSKKGAFYYLPQPIQRVAVK